MAYSWATPLVVVAGDPVAVAQMARRFALTAESIGSAATSLRSLDAASARSDAVDAFMRKAAVLESDLRAARGRYADTGRALGAYSESLATALDQSRPAVRDHERARDDFDAADSLVTKYEGAAMIEPPGPAKDQYEEWAAAQHTRREEARDRITECARRAGAAHAVAGAAAVVAIAQIDDATDDGLRDSFWDDLGGVVHSVGAVVGDAGDSIASAWEGSALRDVLAPGFEPFQEWMQENDAWIAQVVDVLGFVGNALALVGFVVPGLGVFGAIALGLAFLLTAARTAAGTASLLELGLSALSVATMGMGSALVGSAKVAAGGLQARRVSSLIADGYAPAFASKWVQRSLERAAPGFGAPRLWQSLGDDVAAQLRGFLQPGRPGWSPAELETVASIRRQLDVARVLNGAGLVRAASDAVMQVSDDIRTRGSADERPSTAAAW
ncbi:hypothetical protein [Frigoribacterium sp. PvP032]|uniref:hypothetical protein n=1 Tax=Frigoribacterium sp. PvP032 TaxID=2806589 RepID=UPI001AE517FA|nr:hypothetical protein [Frigoribacterium sp. PvP032]MBP1191859.1 hypothetical protein [Frigoribacterium sp. PvP032]